MFAGQLNCCAVLKVRGGGAREKLPCGKFPVTIAGGHHLYPYRTQKLSLQTLMVLSWERLGRVGSCRDPRGAGGTKVFPAPKTYGRTGQRGGRASREAEAGARAERGALCEAGACAKAKRKVAEADRADRRAGNKPRHRPRMILSSSMAEHSAVNRRVVSSSLT